MKDSAHTDTHPHTHYLYKYVHVYTRKRTDTHAHTHTHIRELYQPSRRRAGLCGVEVSLMFDERTRAVVNERW